MTDNANDSTYSVSTAELLACAAINFDNAAKMAPALAQHPIYALAMDQLRCGIDRLRAEDDES